VRRAHRHTAAGRSTQGGASTALRWLLLLPLAVALSCVQEEDAESRPTADPIAGSAPQVPSKPSDSAPPAASKPMPAPVSAGPVAEPPLPPLEDLLRLPPSITDSHHDLESRDPSATDDGEAADPKKREGRVRVRVDSQEEPVGVDQSRSRHRTDAGISVGVDEDTSLRGGVRVEQETDRPIEEPVPTIGIEGRF